MNKVILSSFIIVTFILYSLRTGNLGHAEPPLVSPQTVQVGPPSPTPFPATTATGRYKDGTYTGPITDAYYGNVQVQVTVNGGQITDVQFLDYPQDRRTSIMVNSQAMPLLKTEALQVQSAQVDGVSGATATSQAFIQSLSAALNQAKV